LNDIKLLHLLSDLKTNISIHECKLFNNNDGMLIYLNNIDYININNTNNNKYINNNNNLNQKYFHKDTTKNYINYNFINLNSNKSNNINTFLPNITVHNVIL